MKTIYFDCETTGLNPIKNDIIQIAGIIEDEGKEIEKFNIKIQPTNWHNIDERALEVNKLTIEQLKQFDDPALAYTKILSIFDRYIDRYDRKDKFIVCGYNVGFDISFLKEFFVRNSNNYLFSYFGPIKDPRHIISYLMALDKIKPFSAKLTDVCDYFKIEIENAHDAMYDIIATKEVIKKIDSSFQNIVI